MNALLAGAIHGAFAVSLGAFGAHGLRNRVSSDQLAVWETAVQYHLVHALALIALAALSRTGTAIPAHLFCWGTVVFSGTLYVIGAGGPKWLGMITPIGGLALVAGWLALAWTARQG